MLNINVKELTEWYYQHEICNDCGRPDFSVEKYRTAWNASRLCRTCKVHRTQMDDTEFNTHIDWKQVEREYQS